MNEQKLIFKSMPEAEYINLSELAIYLHIGRSKLYAMVKNNEIPSYRIGKRLIFKISEVKEFVNSNKSSNKNRINSDENE